MPRNRYRFSITLRRQDEGRAGGKRKSEREIVGETTLRNLSRIIPQNVQHTKTNIMVAEMRLRRDHGPRAGMVNSVSSSIRQADPLATRPPPSHALVTPEASLYVAVIHLSPSRFHFLPLSFSLIPRLCSATPCKTAQVLELPNRICTC